MNLMNKYLDKHNVGKSMSQEPTESEVTSIYYAIEFLNIELQKISCDLMQNVKLIDVFGNYRG